MPIDKYVAYDLVNNAVWISKGKNKFGKHHRFKTQKQAYAKARELALKTGYPIYDTYYGKTIKPKKKATKKRAKPKTKRSSIGFDRLF